MAYEDDLQAAITNDVIESANHKVVSFGSVSKEAKQYIASLGSKQDSTNVKGNVWISNIRPDEWRVQSTALGYWDESEKTSKRYFTPSNIFSFDNFNDAKSKWIDLINAALQELG